MDDLLKALGMYQQNVQQAAFTSALNDASAQMQQINMTAKDDTERRQQLTMLANDATLRLLGTGANAAQVQQAFGAIAPPQFATPEAAIMSGVMTGNEGLQKQGMKAQDILFRTDMKKYGAQLALQTAADERRFQREYALQMLKNAPEMAAKNKLTGDDVERITKVDTQLDSAEQILNEFNRGAKQYVGPYAARAYETASYVPGMSSEGYSSFSSAVGKLFQEFKVAMTGANASEKEMLTLENLQPKMTDTPVEFEGKIKRAIQLGNQVRTRRLKNLGLAGKDISGFVRDRMLQEQQAAEKQQLENFISGYEVR